MLRQKTYKKTHKQKTCAHTVVVIMMKNNFTLKRQAKKREKGFESSENPSSHSRITTTLFTASRVIVATGME